MISEKWDEKVIELAKSLINCQSYSGHEDKAAEALKAYMKEAGVFDEIETDCYGNVIGHIKGKNPGSKVLFDGHIDTVPVGNLKDWKHDPFHAVVEDGKLYGRGAADMNGAVAAFTVAAHRYAVENGKNFAGDVYVAGVVHEECFEGVAARKISAKVKPDYVVIGEASEMNLKVGQRGRAEIVVETFGVPAHSANPEKGVNAVYKMCEAIQAIREIEPPVQDKLGKGILELTDVKSSPYPGASVVPEYCRATYDRRLLVGETKESVLQPIIEKMEELKKKDPQFSYKVSYAVGKEECYTGEKIQGERFFPGWLFGAEEEWVAKIKSELEKEGFSPEVTTYNFCTNGSHYAGEADIRTIGMGPARENLAHTIDEYAEVEDLTNVFRCYVGIMKALLG